MFAPEKIDQLAMQVGGETAVSIVRFLIENRENVSEFLIAEKLGFEINTIRKTLYLLQEVNLVNSMRKKDKKKGWYIYYWTFDSSQAIVLINRMKDERISNLKKRLEKESFTTYYSCKKGCLRMPFDRALDHNYTCPECGKVLFQVDNSIKINAIKKELEILELDAILDNPKKSEAAA